ncbi:MAG: TetR/AcrR family transcriptional regulator [Dehalococcoidia bacterium]|nr:TetR/AcrR family transcriptional regulator [Dehalococcoidia bacterium]
MNEPLAPLRPPPRVRKTLRTPNPEVRQRLLDAGRALINEGGYATLRIEDIAAHAGLSVGTFYLYFEGKSDLFVQLVQEYTGHLRRRLLAVGGGAEVLSEADFSRAIDAYLDFVLENERAFLYFVRAAGSMETNMGPLSTWALNSYAQDLQPGLVRAMRAGAARAMDASLASQAIVGLIQHVVVYWLEHRQTCSREALLDFILDFIRSGIGRPSGAGPGARAGGTA